MHTNADETACTYGRVTRHLLFRYSASKNVFHVGTAELRIDVFDALSNSLGIEISSGHVLGVLFEMAAPCHTSIKREQNVVGIASCVDPTKKQCLGLL
jgi:hypothetical protein